MDYHNYIHLDSSVKTVSQFLRDQNSLVKSLVNEPEKFIRYKDSETGTTNADKIWEMYLGDDLNDYPNSNFINESAPLKVGTALMIPKDNINNEMLSILGKDLYLQQADFKAFWSEEFRRIESDPLYIPDNKVKAGQTSINILEANCQVWIYIRAIDSILDVTNFIYSLNISKGREGSFSIDLSAVGGLDDLIYTANGQTINYFSTEKANKSGKQIFQDSYFHKMLQINDIVFIRFEKLAIEKDRNKENDLLIPKYMLPNQIWDMVGLIDTNSQSYSPESNMLRVGISGRDFSKLLTDDGAYFFPYALVEGSDNFFINTDNDNRFLKRMFVNSQLNILFAYSYRSISDTLGFVFNQLTNIGVLPVGNDLFSGYGDARSKTYVINGANKAYLDEVEQNGVWQIVKLLVDGQLADRRIADSSFAKPDGSIMEYVSKVCQSPFVEFWGDTYGAFFNFIARQPPFTKNQILDYLQNGLVVDVNAEDVGDYSIDWETESYSIYQIQPQNSFLGNTQFIAMAHIPVVYFPDYINNFGNKRLSIPTNYISYQAIFGDKRGINADLFKKAIVNDFKYIIESNAYLPFTRKGSVTIRGGDRRIRRGTWIRLNFTGEVAYVDSVSNSLTASESEVNRVTSVQFSRAMKEDHLLGRVGFNYFDVVNVQVVEKLLNAGLSAQPVSKEESKLILNKKAFDYFLQRKQMINEYKEQNYERLLHKL